VGSFSKTIPSGLFKEIEGSFVYTGVINVYAEILIAPVK
jgi:hypothetical protein